jgi:hypothetical protein
MGNSYPYYEMRTPRIFCSESILTQRCYSAWGTYQQHRVQSMDYESISTQYSYSGNELQMQMKLHLNITLM